MALDTRATVAREAIDRLGSDRLEPHELLVEAAARIRRVVPYDMGGWMTLDPDSLLPTGTMRTGKPPALVRQLWDNEIETADLNHFPALTRAADPVATLCCAAATGRRGAPPACIASTAAARSARSSDAS
jgi:hypothetical protein